MTKAVQRLWLASSLFAQTVLSSQLPLPKPEDFGFLSWDGGPPYTLGRAEQTNAPRVLWIETGRYSLAVDTRNLRLVHAGHLPGLREKVLNSSRAAARRLPPGKLNLSVSVAGRVYHCEGLRESNDTWKYPVRFIETGRWQQHLDLDGLVLRDNAGCELEAAAHLEICAWPDRVTFFGEIFPKAAATNVNVALQVTAEGFRSTVTLQKPTSTAITLLVNDALPDAEDPPRAFSSRPDQSEPVVLRRPDLDAWEIRLEGATWSNTNGTGYPSEHLDRLDRWPLTVRNNASHDCEVRLVFTRTSYLPITGLTPMLLDEEGCPTGPPVQLSKNWHLRPDQGNLRHQGPWLRASTVVRVPPRSDRRLQFALCYARWGGVPAASHAQLCLIGWGHNQFWDEAAIGSFGESICYEPGRVQRRCMIDDIRPLMTLAQPDVKRYNWADNGGGGDFLMWVDEAGKYRGLGSTRTDYRAHGPCLTDVLYSEESLGGEIAATMQVSIARSDDYLRAFHHLRYDVRQPVKFQRLAFYQLGADFYNSTPARKVAIGNATNLIQEWTPVLTRNKVDRPAFPLPGAQPWVAVYGVDPSALGKGEAPVSRGVIIRSYKAKLGGKESSIPCASTFATEWGSRNFKTVVEIVPPLDSTELHPGDFVEADLELVMFPALPNTYYGPDQFFRQALEAAPDSWRLTAREAAGNALELTALKGKAQKTYPVRMAADPAGEAEFKLRGGLGFVPVTITRLPYYSGYQLEVDGRLLDQAVHGNDFWQTDYDAASRTWALTWNVPLAGREHRIKMVHQKR